MDYPTLLKQIALYGHGVFTITMIPDKSEQQALRMFIQRNPELFFQLQGNKGHNKLLILTRKGSQYFGARNCPLLKSSEYYTLLDYATINAYLAEIEVFESYKISPREPILFNAKTIGLVSNRWGIPQVPVDLLLASPKTTKQFFPKARPSNLITPRGVLRL